MDHGRFDALTRSLAGNTSRRAVACGLLGGVAAVFGGKGLAGAAPAAKVEICHRTGNGSYQAITVSGNAVNAHLGHGDQICTNPENGTSACTPGGCAVTCADGYHACDEGCCLDGPICDPACENPENGVSTCTENGCVTTCNVGYHDCDAGCCEDVHCDTGQAVCRAGDGNDYCQTVDVAGGQCYWLGPGNEWILFADWISVDPSRIDYSYCHSADYCFPGGGGYGHGGGGCYKWTDTPDGDFCGWV